MTLHDLSIGVKVKNKAKCKLCASIIESFHSSDYVACKCGEIAVNGGSSMQCAALHWENFLRVDDNGNEIIVTIKDENSSDVKPLYNASKPSRKELLDMLDRMIKNIEDLPTVALTTAVTHYDLLSALFLLSSIFRSDCKEDN